MYESNPLKIFNITKFTQLIFWPKEMLIGTTLKEMNKNKLKCNKNL